MGAAVVLSARLKAVADMVREKNRVVDVGCDHGYVPIYLVQSGISPKVLAMDIKEGPLRRAREHVERAGLEEYIALRRSDGLRAYQTGEADTLICAGMGGRLMRKILEAEPEKTKDFEELILQPQSEILAFRRFLKEKGYSICQEEMVWEDGKFYPMIKAVQGKMCSLPYEEELCCRFGPVLLQKKNPTLIMYLKKEWENCLKLRAELSTAEGSSRAEQRLCELEREMEHLEKAAKICGCVLESGGYGRL
ncbi:tRNA (adenine(22)-N(1))-methyltransferase [Parablautia muri]|uniref:SAM-dependent methyltransferase n=1 Tax=Parablautia muri TaxID=2320879 RepID=A0A9X5GR41_9FIRM|nr:class I SAM-dependent methyltransferase [Parablautia muri]NBJ92828.1 SAM-dependent methyltransferase [Parablautia muri]